MGLLTLLSAAAPRPRTPLALALAFVAAPALADVTEVVEAHILPGVEAFAGAAADLAITAAEDCSRTAVLPVYDRAYDAWMQIADLRLGPSEAAPLTIAFWPDERGSGARALTAILAEGGPELTDPAAFASVSAAARGFPGLDLLLGDPDFAYGPADPACTLVRTMTADLRTQAEALAQGWRAFAPDLETPGAAGNIAYLDAEEARAALYTQIVTGLTLTTDTRLARPLGTFERPRPTRAESWRTARSLANALASARANYAMARLLAGQEIAAAASALDQVERAAAAVADPGFQDIADPTARLRLEILNQRITALRLAIETDLPAIWGVSVGFNAQDGD